MEPDHERRVTARERLRHGAHPSTPVRRRRSDAISPYSAPAALDRIYPMGTARTGRTGRWGWRTMGETPTDLVARTRLYRTGRLEKDGFPVEDLSEFLDEPDTVLWVDLCEPDATDLEVVAGE